MGTIKKGILTQQFKITIDVQNLAEHIATIIEKTIAEDEHLSDVEISEYYFDEDELILTGDYSTRFEHWHCDKTLESPEEDEIIREYIGNHVWILSDIPKEIADYISLKEVDENESLIVDDYDE